MSDEGQSGDDGVREAILRLFQTSFPDVRCLRCGHDQLYALPQPAWVARLETVALACARCGHIEQHLESVLSEADKPVPIINPPVIKGEAQ